MPVGDKQRTAIPILRPRPALRWLAIALLVFAQLSFASHVHDLDDAVSHDCTLCSQLSIVEHGEAAHAAVPVLPSLQAVSISANWTLSTRSSNRLLPPARAPPCL